MTTLRSTSQIVQVLQNTNLKLRSTSQVVQVLQNTNLKLRSTSQIIQVLYSISTVSALDADITVDATVDAILSVDASLAATITATAALDADLDIKNHLDAAITATANVSADLSSTVYDYFTVDIGVSGDVVTAELDIPTLSANIQATATVQADVTGIRRFTADLIGTGTVDADLTNYTRLTADITADGDLTADIRENIKYITTDITVDGDITLAELDVPWHAGNTLELQHSVTAELIKNESLESVLDLQHQVDLEFGLRFLSVEDTILFTHEATVIRVLPTKTASSALAFTQTLSDYREVVSYLVLSQSVTGIITFFEGVASSVLNLTDLVSSAGSIFNLSVESQLNLTQSVDGDQEAARTVTSSLNLQQNVFAVVLGSKKYVLFQAPFELIQTSIVLPNPLLDDNEGLVSNLLVRRSMNNTLRTYVQTTKNRRLRYTFVLNRLKALELEAFFDAYNGADIKMLNWKGEIWRIKLITNPLDFVQTRRASPGGDRTDVNLEFEGVKIYG